MSQQANISENSRRVARNTLLLYVRMFVMMLVGLYTSRVIINALGQDDFGTYGAVGGIVSLFIILTGALSGAISRFLAFELGKKEEERRLEEVFSTTVMVQLGMSLIILLLAESLGVWFLNARMNIPVGRMGAANWVLQCSIFVFIANMMGVPYNAAIIAHEKMEVFAYFSIIEALLTLGVALATRYSSFDKLITYAVLMLAVAVIVQLMYAIYASRHFGECHAKWKNTDRGILKEVASYTGWTFLGNGAAVLNGHGVNILMNLFFGVRVNSAREVTVKLEGTITKFVTNFTTALNPQITKSYASGNKGYMHELVCKGAKYSYLLLFFFVLPIVLETPILLKLWLKTYPELAVPFVRISFVSVMLNAMGNPFAYAISSTGNVKAYQIVSSVTNVMAFPLSYIAFKMGYPPQVSYWIIAVAALVVFAERVLMACSQVQMPVRKALSDVVLRVIAVTVTASVVPCLLCFLQEPGIVRMLEVVAASFVMSAAAIYLFGATPGERRAAVSFVKDKLKRKK